MRIRFLCSALLLLLAPASPAQQVNHVLKLEYTSTADYTRGQVVKASQTSQITRYYAPDGTVRTETQDFVHHRTTLTLSNEKQGYEIWMDPSTKTATRVDALIASVKSQKIGALGEKLDLGQSNIQGYTCQGFQNELPGAVTIKHWFCTDPHTGVKFLGRVETTMGNSTTIESLQSVTSELSFPQQFFAVPSGYAIVRKTPTEMFGR